MTDLRTRHGLDQLLAATERHPFIRCEITEDRARTWWQVEGAVAFLRTRRANRETVNLLGDDSGIETLLDHLGDIAAALGDASSAAAPPRRAVAVTLPQHLEPFLHQRFRVGEGGDWEWFHTTIAPPETSGSRAVSALDDVARADQVTAFLERHSPTADTMPGEGQRWFAIDNADGSLAAVAALGLTAAGAPHLSSVAVDTALRGRGLGRAIVSAATRVAVLESGVCTLGMYSTNDVGRELYVSLGYERVCAWSSRPVSLSRAAVDPTP